jgi:hypothetical protein
VSQVRVVDIDMGRTKPVALPPVLAAVRHTAKIQLSDLQQSLFDNTDDALFELADKSQSDVQQEMYFESMRHVRLHRKKIASEFIQNFVASFPKLLEPITVTANDDESDENEKVDYTLIGQDDLEMTVAVAGIVSKVTSLHSLTIMQLTKRISAVIAPLSLTERTNPLGPYVLSTAFSDALDGLEVNMKVRIIIMKLFERFVMERMGPVYDNVNKQLIQAGILPDLKDKPSRTNQPKNLPQQTDTKGSATVHSTAAQTGPGRGSEAEEFGFATVQSLLANIRTGQPGFVARTDHEPGEAMTVQDVLAALTYAQQNIGNSHVDVETTPTPLDFRQLVLDASTDKSSNKLGQADDDTVNFVGLLFDYILNDRNLAIPMKALIGRLQIPILKVALLDKTFFSKSAHAARVLLNDLSSAGIGWSTAKELKRDALYNKIETIVHTVLNDFNDNPELFDELLTVFRAYVSKDNRRSVLVEQRVKDTEQGKARTQKAKQAVQTVINQKACGLRLPQEVGRFVSDVWSRVLTLRCVKHGNQSPHWTAGVATLDELLWVLQPLCELDDVNRREEISQSLMQRLDEGMTEVGIPQDENEAFNTWLSVHLTQMSNNDRAYLDVDGHEELETPTAIVEEIVLSSIKETPRLELSSKIGKEIKAITEGSWVEIQEEGQDPLRCKLATVTQPGDNYVFVNKRGMKVTEKNRMQLAGLLEKDCLKLVDESQIFDRALQSVITNLRELQRNRPINQ